MRLGHNSFQRNRRIKRILLTRFSKFQWTAVETWHASISNYLTSMRILYEFSTFLLFLLYLSYLSYDPLQSRIFIFLFMQISRYYINSDPRIIRERRHRRMKIFLSSSLSFLFLFYESFIKNDRMLPTRCRDIIKICLLGFDLIPPTIPLVPFPTAVLSRHLGRRFFTNPTFVTNQAGCRRCPPSNSQPGHSRR